MTALKCFDQQTLQDGGPALFSKGSIHIQAHDIGWLVSGFFTIVAMAVSFWLVNKHLTHYTNKHEQRYIVRILFMVPIYACVSLASFLFWDHSTALLLIRDCYESTVLTSFFYLLLLYISPHPDEQRAIFLKYGLSKQADIEARMKGKPVRKWAFPLYWIKKKPKDGLYFLQIMKWGILQYCILRPLTTLIAVILNYIGLYCNDSWGLGWGHVYITVTVSISVSVAMYCLIQLYLPVSEVLAPQKPLLKLFAIKAVVFLTFWQSVLLSVLSMFSVVKGNDYMTADDVNIGIGAMLECFEMMLFAFLHVKAFSYKPYVDLSKYPDGPRMSRLRALGHAFDFRETFREIAVGFTYFIDHMRGREARHDKSARRYAHHESAFGRPRPSYLVPSSGAPSPSQVRGDPRQGSRGIKVDVEEDIAIDGEKQWFLGEDYLLPHPRREQSEALALQIEKELTQRGYGPDSPTKGTVLPAGKPARDEKPDPSWWRSVYNRISQSSRADTQAGEKPLPRLPSKRRRSVSRQRRSRDTARDRLLPKTDYDDPPPTSYIRQHRKQKRGQGGSREVSRDPGVPLLETDVPRLAQPPSSLHHQLAAKDPGPMAVTGLAVHSAIDENLPPAQSEARPNRNDSLLGRVFPPSVADNSTIDHNLEQSMPFSHYEPGADYGPERRPSLGPNAPMMIVQAPSRNALVVENQEPQQAGDVAVPQSAQYHQSMSPPPTSSPPLSPTAHDNAMVNNSTQVSTPVHRGALPQSAQYHQSMSPPPPPLSPPVHDNSMVNNSAQASDPAHRGALPQSAQYHAPMSPPIPRPLVSQLVRTLPPGAQPPSMSPQFYPPSGSPPPLSPPPGHPQSFPAPFPPGPSSPVDMRGAAYPQHPNSVPYGAVPLSQRGGHPGPGGYGPPSQSPPSSPPIAEAMINTPAYANSRPPDAPRQRPPPNQNYVQPAFGPPRQIAPSSPDQTSMHVPYNAPPMSPPRRMPPQPVYMQPPPSPYGHQQPYRDRRMSAPMDSIPQYSVPQPVSPPPRNRPRNSVDNYNTNAFQRPPYPMDGSRDRQPQRPPEMVAYSPPNGPGRYPAGVVPVMPRRLAIPAGGPVMPRPLAQQQPVSPPRAAYAGSISPGNSPRGQQAGPNGYPPGARRPFS